MDDALELSRLGQLPAVLLAVCSQLQAGLEQLLDKGLVALEVKHQRDVRSLRAQRKMDQTHSLAVSRCALGPGPTPRAYNRFVEVYNALDADPLTDFGLAPSPNSAPASNPTPATEPPDQLHTPPLDLNENSSASDDEEPSSPTPMVTDRYYFWCPGEQWPVSRTFPHDETSCGGRVIVRPLDENLPVLHGQIASVAAYTDKFEEPGFYVILDGYEVPIFVAESELSAEIPDQNTSEMSLSTRPILSSRQ